ncbi:MAG: bifunctional sulfate adenylyltransferase/adenylylsulfate kinase [Deltaproteobacteria bacterium]|nr:bifunctional sulfate adenylyltransferase/adenylylsulfate kinase [Deltaproteobacteria bacterium]
MKDSLNHSESLLVHFRRMESLKAEAVRYPSIHLNKRQLCNLELLLNRAFYPLTGYLTQEDYERVLDFQRLSDDTVWPVPICLDISEKSAQSLSQNERIALRDEEGFILAVLKVKSLWKPDLRKEALRIWGTEDPEKHPGVRSFFDETGSWYVGGSLEGIQLPFHYDFNEIRLTPPEVHRRFSRNGWRNVLGFHAEDFLHRSHVEAILSAAREANSSILIHPSIGLGDPGEPRYYALVRSYFEILRNFPKNLIMLALLPSFSIQAGPREALLQAIVRKNFGCSHFLVARDHADPFAGQSGTERFYPPHSARKLVEEYESETGIKMVPFEPFVYVKEKAEFVSPEELGAEMQPSELSPSELLRRMENDLKLPEWFTYPEVVAELKLAFPPKSAQGFTIFLTGLSGSGKSTLAKVLLVKLMEMRDRPVTLLDGDIVRKNLSSELDFSKEHRDLNIRRIGFVASQITKNGGIAICAPIAPYEESRRHNRELISQYGGYIEVYLSTPLETCELRDAKGVYAKARAGKIKGFTGIDDPYVPPANPEITIDTREFNPIEAAQKVLLFLEEQGYVR